VIQSSEDDNELTVFMKGRNFLASTVTITFPTKLLVHGISLLYVQSQPRISIQVLKMYKTQEFYYTNQHKFGCNLKCIQDSDFISLGNSTLGCSVGLTAGTPVWTIGTTRSPDGGGST
jgi:hypothetical protein